MILDAEVVDKALLLVADKHVNRIDGNLEEEDSDILLVVQDASAASAGSEVVEVGGGNVDHNHTVGAAHRPFLGADTGFP